MTKEEPERRFSATSEALASRMPASRHAAALAALLLTACSPQAPENDAPEKAAVETPACPPEQLSCGLQKPVRSDGVTPFENADMGLTAVFPEGAPVCLARSGDAPRGFFVNYGDGQGCSERPGRGPRFITLHADHNALFVRSAAEALPGDCRPLSDALQRRLAGALAIPGHASAACQGPAAEGAVEVMIYAMAGETEGETPGSRVPAVVYFAGFGTTQAHFDEDLARFRSVLASVRLDPS